MGRTIFSLIALVIAGAVFFLYTQPTYDQVSVVNAQVAQYDEALNKAAELQKLKQSLLSKFNTFNPNDIDKLQKLLPDHVDNVRLILDIDSLATKHGMPIQNVVVTGSQVNTGSQTAIGTVASSRQKYDSLTIKFATQGDYQSFRDFLTDLETSLRVVDLIDLSISRTGANGAQPVYSYDVTLRTYWLK